MAAGYSICSGRLGGIFGVAFLGTIVAAGWVPRCLMAVKFPIHRSRDRCRRHHRMDESACPRGFIGPGHPDNCGAGWIVLARRSSWTNQAFVGRRRRIADRRVRPWLDAFPGPPPAKWCSLGTPPQSLRRESTSRLMVIFRSGVDLHGACRVATASHATAAPARPQAQAVLRGELPVLDTVSMMP